MGEIAVIPKKKTIMDSIMDTRQITCHMHTVLQEERMHERLRWNYQKVLLASGCKHRVHPGDDNHHFPNT